jgi:hypothetical protein
MKLRFKFLKKRIIRYIDSLIFFYFIQCFQSHAWKRIIHLYFLRFLHLIDLLYKLISKGDFQYFWHKYEKTSKSVIRKL